MTVATKYVNVNSLNVRNAPAGAISYTLPYATMITVILENTMRINGWTWIERAKYRGQWVALELLTDTNPVQTPAQTTLKIGLHLSMYNYDSGELISTLKAMTKTGRFCPGILLLGPSELAAEALRNASPNTLIVSRVYYDGDQGRELTAGDYFRRFVFGDPNRASIRYHQINNENNDLSPAAIKWWLEQMAWANLNGYRLVVPTLPTGNPADLNEWKRADVLDFLRAIRDGGHLLAFHEYYRDDGDWELFRFLDHVFPMLPADLQRNMPRTVITEFGIQGGRDYPPESWLSMLKTWQARLAGVPWIISVMAWAIGDTGGSTNPGQNWQRDNWANKLSVYRQV